MIPFLLLLGIASDALGFLALALFYPTGDLTACQRRADFGRRARRGVRSCGGRASGASGRICWGGRPFLVRASSGAGSIRRSRSFRSCRSCPTRRAIPDSSLTPAPTARDALSQFEVWWRYPAQIALFFFGLVNAGVPFTRWSRERGGCRSRSSSASRSGSSSRQASPSPPGLHLPHRVGWRELIVVGFAASIGFSVGLFFCAAVLPPGQLRSETGMGVLLSLAGAPLALMAASSCPSAGLLATVRGRFARSAFLRARSPRLLAGPQCEIRLKRHTTPIRDHRAEPNTNPIERSMGLKNRP